MRETILSFQRQSHWAPQASKSATCWKMDVFNGADICMGVFNLLGRELEGEMMDCVVAQLANRRP